jgi:hypothetical protein
VGSVAVRRIEHHRRLGARAGGAAGDLDAGDARHSQVDERDVGLSRLDLLERFVAVLRPAGDLDPVLGEKGAHRLHHHGMVVGDKAADRALPGRQKDPFWPEAHPPPG